ncbi:MAG: alpha/beta hydrolase [Candidatus Omnitrophica bacterium]|nr:alpha/beta hydrolase [Candidatus Omnitrophota bacterium]
MAVALLVISGNVFLVFADTIATSADGTVINYYEHGQERPVLVFVHGWSCDASYWKEQIEYFKEKYRMVLIDLAGHGRSGSERENYTMEAFGQDVKAVVENIGAEKAVLIGHSMGALVIAETARLMPEKDSCTVWEFSFASVPVFKIKSVPRIIRENRGALLGGTL